MKKRIVIVLFLLAILITTISGCKKEEKEQEVSSSDLETVQLLLWGSKEDEALLNKMIQTFQQEYQGQANFQITFAEQGETECKDVILGGLEESADVYVENADVIKQMNLSTAVEAATVRNTLYAYPLTADNGYFLYYNKRYFSEEDIQTLDRILEIASANDSFFLWIGLLPGMWCRCCTSNVKYCKTALFFQ